MLRVFFAISLLVLVSSNENPQLTISDGKIEGTILQSREGRQIFAFRGIPYAEPPLGQFRFKPPVPKKSWKNVLNATVIHNICPQINIFSKRQKMEGKEDCLFLNVYTPRLPSENPQPLPVMVFIHGGAFMFGSGDYSHYGPELLLDQDIVLVTGNYRLGALGFLSTGDEVSPGNYGLKDQALLLKWVNKNIEHFGGDPKSVTLFGESAGAASTHFHMFSPLSSGLFKGIISQSGSAFNFWALAPPAENAENVKKLAENVNCSTSSSKDSVECLRKIDASILVDEVVKIMRSQMESIIQFRPVVEPPSDTAFLTDTPYKLLKAKKFSDVPWIVGMNKMEGLMKSVDYVDKSVSMEDLNENFNKNVVRLFKYKLTNDTDTIGEQIKKFYFGDGRIEVEKSFSAITDMYTDAWFTIGMDEAMENFRKVSKNSLFTYIFDHNGPLSLTSIISSSDKFYGSCHVDELMYLFTNVPPTHPDRKIADEEKKFIKFFTTLWANFAKTGNPTPELNNIVRNKWNPVASDKLEFYNISPNMSGMGDALFENRVNFWRNMTIKTKKDEEN